MCPLRSHRREQCPEQVCASPVPSCRGSRLRTAKLSHGRAGVSLPPPLRGDTLHLSTVVIIQQIHVLNFYRKLLRFEKSDDCMVMSLESMGFVGAPSPRNGEGRRGGLNAVGRVSASLVKMFCSSFF